MSVSRNLTDKYGDKSDGQFCTGSRGENVQPHKKKVAVRSRLIYNTSFREECYVPLLSTKSLNSTPTVFCFVKKVLFDTRKYFLWPKAPIVNQVFSDFFQINTEG